MDVNTMVMLASAQLQMSMMNPNLMALNSLMGLFPPTPHTANMLGGNAAAANAANIDFSNFAANFAFSPLAALASTAPNTGTGSNSSSSSTSVSKQGGR